MIVAHLGLLHGKDTMVALVAPLMRAVAEVVLVLLVWTVWAPPAPGPVGME